MNRLILSIHDGCVNKSGADKVDTGWRNPEEKIATVDNLINWIKKGHGWCATRFRDGHRRKANATTSNMVVFDIDGHISINDWWGHTKVQQWCAFTYTTASHTEAAPRFRAVFPLNTVVESAEKHEAVYDAIWEQIRPDLEPKFLTDAPFDHSGRQNSKLWYGNTEAQVEANINCSGVPGYFIDGVEVVEKGPSGPITPADDLSIAQAQWGLTQLRPSEDGEYESFYWPILKGCGHIGPVIYDDLMQWALRGWHGSPDNKKAQSHLDFNRKLQSVKCDGSVAKLFHYFKEFIGPDWKKGLPEHLKDKYKPKIGYSEAEPSPDFGNSESPRARQKTVQKKSGRLSLGDQKDVVCQAFPRIRQNVMTTHIEVVDDSGAVLELDGDKLNNIYIAIYELTGIELNKTVAADLINTIAERNPFNPIIEYLESVEHLPAHPHWDNLGPWLLGNDSAIANDALQRILVAAVARSYEPGCSMSWLPILVGAQGAGKSQLVKSLVPSDFMAEINAPLEQLEREPSLLHRGMLLELGEIDHYFKATTVESFKNIISTSIDQVRLPYARKPQRMPRRFVMFGTTNRSQFLVDPTGNRRFVPLEIPMGFEVPWRRVEEERDQLWSAALAAYRAGSEHEYRTGEIAKLRDYIQQFNDDDVWTQDITSYLATVEETTTRDVLRVGLNVDIHKTGAKESRRVNDILTRLGWRRQQTSRGGRSVRIWIRPEGDSGPDQSHIKEDF